MDTQVRPFESFSIVYKMLIRFGFYKNFYERNSCVLKWHNLYRAIALFILFLYNVIHLIFIFQPSNPSDLRVDALMIEIPQINLLSKVLTLSLYSPRVDKINELINDPIFAARGVADEKFLLTNIKETHRLSRVINVFTTIAGVFWPITNFFQALRDESTVIPIYVPFKIDTTRTKLIVILILQAMPLPWIGYGHIALDCLVVIYYAQAQVQLKIIKHNLKHLFDKKDKRNNITTFKHITDVEVYENFVHYIKRYEKLVWYINEVNLVFNPSMSIQFLTSSSTLCMVIYALSETYLFSVKFFFLLALIVILLIQIFLYCYYGNLVRYESESLNTCLFASKWTSSSARVRRAMLIAMTRWSRPLTMQVATIIPLALDTFISIVRLSYTLYTVLSTQHEIHK